MCLGVSRLSRQLRTVAAHRFRRRLSPTAYVPEAAFCLTGDALYDEDDRWHRIVSLATQSPSVPIGGFNAAFKTHTIPLEFRQFNLSYARRELSPKTVHSRARLLFTQHVIHWKDRIALKWKTPEGLLEAIDDASVGTVPNVCRYIGRATGLLDRNHDERHLLFKEHIKKFDAHWLWTAFEYKAIEFLAYDMKPSHIVFFLLAFHRAGATCPLFLTELTRSLSLQDNGDARRPMTTLCSFSTSELVLFYKLLSGMKHNVCVPLLRLVTTHFITLNNHQYTVLDVYNTSTSFLRLLKHPTTSNFFDLYYASDVAKLACCFSTILGNHLYSQTTSDASERTLHSFSLSSQNTPSTEPINAVAVCNRWSSIWLQRVVAADTFRYCPWYSTFSDSLLRTAEALQKWTERWYQILDGHSAVRTLGCLDDVRYCLWDTLAPASDAVLQAEHQKQQERFLVLLQTPTPIAVARPTHGGSRSVGPWIESLAWTISDDVYALTANELQQVTLCLNRLQAQFNDALQCFKWEEWEASQGELSIRLLCYIKARPFLFTSNQDHDTMRRVPSKNAAFCQTTAAIKTLPLKSGKVNEFSCLNTTESSIYQK